jgi:hypothetical protein
LGSSVPSSDPELRQIVQRTERELLDMAIRKVLGKLGTR